MQHQEEAEVHQPQPTSTPAPNDGKEKKIEHGDGLVVRRTQSKPPAHILQRMRQREWLLRQTEQFEFRKVRVEVKSKPSTFKTTAAEQFEFRKVMVEARSKPSTAKTKAAFKDKHSFRDRYFHANKAQENHRMREQARRHKLLGDRHEYSEKWAWRGTLRLLEQDSPEGAKHYKKRMETIRLPEGIFARWLRDPGESILEVMQRTGSHVQIVPGKDAGLFSSLTLLGLPSQNAAARNLLQESDLLGAVSEDDLDAMKSLADYHLRSEVSDRHGKALEEDDDNIDGGIDESLYDLLDDVELGQLENAVDITTENRAADVTSDHVEGAIDTPTEVAPTRAVWSRASATFDIKRTARQSSSDPVSGPLNSVAPTSAASLAACIEDLTAPIPRQAWLKQFESLDQSQYAVRTELVALLTNPDNAHLVTPLAVWKALEYLAHHAHFPAVRDIMNALKDTKLALNVDVFNKLLAAAAKAENTHAFHYIVVTMRRRGIPPNAETWHQFLSLMAKRHPEEVDKVHSRMQKKAIHADLSAKIKSLETYSTALLASFMASYPDASLQEFVKNVSDDMPGVKWLTSFSANTMCQHLLKSGNTAKAFELVDELVISGGRPDVVTLNTFLSAAEKDGNMEMAVGVVRKFHDLHANSTPLAETNADRFAALPRVHDLSIRLNQNSFLLLCLLAWQRKHFNCFRVFWRYACCAGHVNADISRKLQESIKFTAGKGDIATLSGPHKNARARMWKAWAARFALGVQAGLDARGAANVMSIVRSVQTVTDNEPATSTAGPESQQTDSPRSLQPATTEQSQLLADDLKEVQSLHPTSLLVDMAEEAYAKDIEWKANLIGTPKGLQKFESADHMFEHMLQDGVEVPVVVGDATAIEL